MEGKVRAELCFLAASLLQSTPLAADSDEEDGIDEAGAGLMQVAAAAKGEYYVSENCIEALATYAERFMAVLGQRAQGFAELAGRSEVTIGDMGRALALFEMDVEDLREYCVHYKAADITWAHRDDESVEEYVCPVPQTVPRVLVDGSVPRVRPAYLPSFLPDFPDVHSYMHTAAYEEILTSYVEYRRRVAQTRIDSQQNLIRQAQRTGMDKVVQIKAPQQFHLAMRDLLCAPARRLPFLAPFCSSDDPAPVPVPLETSNPFLKQGDSSNTAAGDDFDRDEPAPDS